MPPYTYHINEFSVESEFPLPHDSHARSLLPPKAPDHIVIRRASLADIPCLMRKVRPQIIYDVGDGFLLEPPRLAMHIDYRARIFTVDCPEETLAVAAAWAIHAGLGASTITRGGAPLHGAGLEVEGRYIALMADSGAGKSTLSAYLLQHGARFGNDDLVPVYVANGRAVAYPSLSLHPKLSREAVDRYGLDPASLIVADYGTGEEEYYVPPPNSRRIAAPAPLAAVFLLRPKTPVHGSLQQIGRMRGLVTVRRLPEEEAAQTLERNLHALWLIGKWIDQRRIAALCQSMAASVPLYELSYPRAFALLPQLRQVITTLAGELPVAKSEPSLARHA